MKHLSRLSILVMLSVLFAGSVQAQEVPGKVKSRSDRFSLGYNLNQFGKDFGVGFNLNSPYIKKVVAIKSSMSFQWVETGSDKGTEWMSYQNIRLGVASSAATLCDCVRLYGEGGATLLILDPKISTNPVSIGGYGIFGFEFFMGPPEQPGMSYFIELGGIGTGATADKLVNKPLLSNGFITSTGFRIYF